MFNGNQYGCLCWDSPESKHVLSGEIIYGSVADFLAGTLEWSWPGRLKPVALKVADRP